MHIRSFSQDCCKYLTLKLVARLGSGWFSGTAVITEESKHSAGADLLGLSLVEQERANGLELSDSKVGVIQVKQWRGDDSVTFLEPRSCSSKSKFLANNVNQKAH